LLERIQFLPVGTEEDIPFGVWLHRQMKMRGYEMDGPRAGGRTRLAKETGINLSIISRILNDNRVPEIKALRAIGDAFGYSLGEMMVHARVAGPEEITSGLTAPGTMLHSGREVPQPAAVELPPGLSLQDLPEDERRVWLLPGFTAEERGMMVAAVRYIRDPSSTPNLEELWLRMLPTMARRLPELMELVEHLYQRTQPSTPTTHRAS